MDLVVDANVLVGELLRPRGRELLQRSELQLYAVPKVLDEAGYELRRRLTIMRNQGRFNGTTEQELLGLATGVMDSYISLVAESFYAPLEAEARKRIPRVPNDWEIVALALVLPAAIWTEDYDFFGCGCPTWTTETLMLQLQ